MYKENGKKEGIGEDKGKQWCSWGRNRRDGLYLYFFREWDISILLESGVHQIIHYAISKYNIKIEGSKKKKEKIRSLHVFKYYAVT